MVTITTAVGRPREHRPTRIAPRAATRRQARTRTLTLTIILTRTLTLALTRIPPPPGRVTPTPAAAPDGGRPRTPSSRPSSSPPLRRPSRVVSTAGSPNQQCGAAVALADLTRTLPQR